jgi:predicted ATPase
MKITAKNYRCYSEKNPLRITFSEGITSFVGVNNAGKSTIFRLIYELRNLWELLSRKDISLFKNPNNTINISFGLAEPLTIFCEQNNNDISVEICLRDSTLVDISEQHWVHTAVFSASRENVNNWNVRLYYDYNELLDIRKLKNEGSGYFYEGGDGKNFISLDAFFKAMDILNRCIYFGANRYASGKSGSRHFDLPLGKDFVNQWRTWKLGNETKSKKITTRIQKDIRNIFQFRSLEINPANNGEDMELVIDDAPAKLSEMGDGISQFIITFGIAGIRQPSFILIDEPEHGLHATMQLDFVTSLASYAKHGMMFSTHSIGLARSVSDGKIISVHKTKDGAHARDMETISHLPELLGELNYSAYRDLGFDMVLLVEGTTEVKVFQQILRKFGLDHEVVILPLGGNSLARGNVEHEISEIKRLANGKLAAIVDSERQSISGAPDSQRQEFHLICERLFIPCLLTERRATENYLTQSSIDLAFGRGRYKALDTFEKHDSGTHWKKSENWRIAREMTKDEIECTDIGAFIQKNMKPNG